MKIKVSQQQPPDTLSAALEEISRLNRARRHDRGAALGLLSASVFSPAAVGVFCYLQGLEHGHPFPVGLAVLFIACSSIWLVWGTALWLDVRSPRSFAALVGALALTAAAFVAGAYLDDPLRLLGVDGWSARLLGTHMVTLDAQHQALVLEGPIHEGLLVDTKAAIAHARAEHITLRTLILKASPGGAVDEIYTTAAAMHDAGINHAVVLGECLSACALLWASMPRGEVSAGGALGFHAMRFGTTSEKARSAAINNFEGVLERRGFSVAWVHRFEQVPPSRMYLMTQADLSSIGAIRPPPPAYADIPLPAFF